MLISPYFFKVILRTLDSWRHVTEGETRQAIQALYQDMDNIAQAVEIGLKFEETWQAAAQLIVDRRRHITYTNVAYWRPLAKLASEKARAQHDFDLAAQLLLALGEFERNQGDIELATATHRVALTHAKQSGNRELIGQALYFLSQDYRLSGRFQEAISLSLTSYQLLRLHQVGIEWQANCLQAIGGAFLRLRQSEQAIIWLEQAVVLGQQGGSQTNLAIYYQYLGDAYAEAGRFDESETELNHALAIYKRLDNRSHYLDGRVSLGVLAYRQEQYQHALDIFRSLDFDHLRAIGNLHTQGVVMSNIGHCLIKMGQIEESVPPLVEAADTFRKGAFYQNQADTLLMLGESYEHCGRLEEAQQSYRHILALYEKVGKPLKATCETAKRRLDDLANRSWPNEF